MHSLHLLRPLLGVSDKILSRASEMGLQQTHPGLRAATRHGVRDPLVRSQVESLARHNMLQNMLLLGVSNKICYRHGGLNY